MKALGAQPSKSSQKHLTSSYKILAWPYPDRRVQSSERSAFADTSALEVTLFASLAGSEQHVFPLRLANIMSSKEARFIMRQ